MLLLSPRAKNHHNNCIWLSHSGSLTLFEHFPLFASCNFNTIHSTMTTQCSLSIYGDGVRDLNMMDSRKCPTRTYRLIILRTGSRMATPF